MNQDIFTQDDFKDRPIDKVKVDSSKKLMWNHINSKYNQKNNMETNAFLSFFKALFTPKKIAWTSMIATVTLIAIIFGPNLQMLIQSGQLTTRQVVSAHFDMEADLQDSAGIEENSTFTLTSSEDYDETTIAENLKVSPETKIEVTKLEEGKYKIAPENKLNQNSVYNFTIVSETETGNEEYSWAYQVKETFKITGTLPGDKTNGVPLETGIEFYFSHEQLDLETVNQYFSITPEVKGHFEKHQRALVFIPDTKLLPETLYKVEFKEGFQLQKSDLSLAEGISFGFETTYQTDEYVPRRGIYFNHNSYEVGVGKTIALTAYDYKATYSYADDEDEQDQTPIPVEIYKFNTEADFQNALNEKNKIPYWASYANENFAYDKNTLSYVGTFDGFMDTMNWQSYIYLPTANLEAGQYLLQVNDGENLNQATLQVTDLSTYEMISETYSIMWVNDLATKSAVNKAKIEILGNGKSFETNSEGIGQFTLLKGETEESYIFKITSPDGKVLFSQINIPGKDSLASNYWYTFLTDRPMYQPDDTVQFWAYIKPRNARVNIDNLNITLYQGWYMNPTESIIANVPIETSGNTFSGTFQLNDLAPGYYNLLIKSGDEIISSEAITVENYAKPTYNITLTEDKKAVFAGETVNFEVQTNFFDGTPVPSLKLTYYEDYKGTQFFTTDENGKSEFQVNATKSKCNSWKDYCYDKSNLYINVTPELSEDVFINANVGIRVFDSRINLNASSTKDDETDMAKIELDTHFITLDKINNETEESYDDYLGDPVGEQKITAAINEVSWEKVEDGQHYDFINKKVVKDYTYNRIENWLPEFEIITDSNGHATYEFKVDEDKYYQVYFKTADSQGNEAYDNTYIYGGATPEQSDYYALEAVGKDIENNLWAKYDIGENVSIEMKKGEGSMPNDAGGRFLFMQQLNGLQDYEISEKPYYDFKFANENVPGLYITGVWFDGSEYNIAYDTSVYFNYDDKKLNIEITKNKDSYEPGEEVKLKVKVTDINGNPVESYVNLNLVDEAYYKIAYDGSIDTLTRLYAIPNSGAILSARSHKNPASAMMDFGMGGCFTGETQILMSGGIYKSIKDIVPGDIILTKQNEYSSELVQGDVTKTFVHKVDGYMVINNMLEVTSEHVMFINGKWQIAGNIKYGDIILDKNGDLVEVKSLELKREPAMVYNFEVKKYHTYFANNIYVHNDKGGDGIRNEFEDTALFETIKTGGNGEGEVKFQVPDNITSWRVTAQAIDGKNMLAGNTASQVIATLPVFGDLVVNKEYSVKDSPMILGRAFGNEISAGDETVFKLVAESLGLDGSETKTSNAFNPVYFDLGKLKLGEHTLVLETKANGKADKLSETIEVKGSRLKETVVDYIEKIESENDLKFPKDGNAEIYFIDAGFAKIYWSLINLYNSEGDRIDQNLSEVIAINLLDKEFNQKFNTIKKFDPAEYQHEEDGGLMLLPYSTSDLRLSAIVAAVETDITRYREKDLKQYFYSFYRNPEANLDEITMSLLGLASMNEPVLQSLKQIKDAPELSIKDKLYVGIAFANLGDKQNAKALLAEVSPQLQMKNSYETALGAILASAVQSRETASELWNYVNINGIEDDILNLYEIGYVKNAIKYVSHDPVKFKLEIDGDVQNIDLSTYGTRNLIASKDQKIKIKDIQGDLAAVIKYENLIEPENFKVDPSVQITRTYKVNGKETNEFYEGDTVEIVISVKGEKEKGYRVTDVMPSGLKLLTSMPVFGPYTTIMSGNYPYSQNGQEVSFYAYTEDGTDTISYYATVVNPGQFYSDPAKIESYMNLDITNISKPNMVTIKPYDKEKAVEIEPSL
ncbi:hypothetical protein KKD70_01750 [Patescibacteria group bacterium]|nr:hypothetical protein [Patescibacteria group bacterium]